MSITIEIERINQSFAENLQSVKDLMNFDEIVLISAIHQLEDLSDKLKKHHKIDNPYLSVDGTIRNLKNIRSNNSLEIIYKRVFNQCLVLLVSYFASTIRDVFQSSIDEAIEIPKFEKVAKTKIELSLLELKTDVEKVRLIGEILATQKEISFQDMQSIARTFQDYFAIEIPKDINTNNIIVAQAFRHAIVHSGARIDLKLIKQLANANPRTVKKDIELNSEILFSPEEVETIGNSMQVYLNNLFVQLKLAYDVV